MKGRALVLSELRFIGRAVVRELLDTGMDVVVVTPEAPRQVDPRAEVRVAPRSELRGMWGDLGPVAALVDVDAATRADAQLAAEAAAAQPSPPAVVVLTSVDVYRAFEALMEARITEAVPLTESSPLRSRVRIFGQVDATRADLEHLDVEEVYQAASALGATVLRAPVVYGPGDERRREWPWIRRILDQRRVLPMGVGWIGWAITRAYVGDVARAVALCLERREDAAGEVFNLGEPETLPWGALAQAVSRAAGAEVEIVPVPDSWLPPHLHPGPYAPQPILVDSQHIRGRLGFSEARSQQESLALTVQWHLQNPPDLEDEEDLPDYAAEERLMARLRSEGPASG